jgi:spermidine synthase
VSGGAALIFEVGFLRLYGPDFGGDAVAVAAVLAAFFAGMALGSFLFGSIAERKSRPIRLYGLLAIGVGLAALLLVIASDPIEHVLGRILRSTGSLEAMAAPRFLAAFVLLLVPTTLVGGTLPAVARAVAPGSSLAAGAGSLYAWNTLGAVAGTLACAFLLLPALGIRGTIFLASALSVAAGLLALLLDRAGAPKDRRSTPEAPLAPSPPVSRVAIVAFALSGFAALAGEVLWTRALSQFSRSSVYSFAMMLAVFLSGIALGSGFAAAVARRIRSPGIAGALVQGALGAWTLFTIHLLRRHYDHALHFGRPESESFTEIALGETRLAMATLLVPALLSGAFFPIVLRIAEPRGGAARSVGVLLGANTLAGVAGSLAAAFVLLPALGLRGALVATAAVSAAAALFLAATAKARPAARLAGAAAGLAVVLPLALTAPRDLRFWAANPGEMLVDYREGSDANVAVIRHTDHSLSLRTNRTFSQGGGEGLLIERRQALLAAILHPDPGRALVLGLGTGTTAGALLRLPRIQIDVIEILPGVVELSRRFAPWNDRLHENLRARIQVGDAVRFVRQTDARYDLVLGDLFHPGERGAGALFTREHFAAVRSRLAPGGIFCQWLPLHQLSPGEAAIIGRTFLDVFPHASLWLAYPHALDPIAALIGAEAPLDLDPARLEARLREPSIAAPARELGLEDPAAVLGLRVAGADALAQWTRDAKVATRDRPLIEFSSPRKEARRRSFPEENLAALLSLWSPLASPEDDAGAPRPDRIESFAEATRRLVRGHLYRMQRLRTSTRDEIPLLLRREIDEYRAALDLACDYEYLNVVVDELLNFLTAETRYAEALSLAEHAASACDGVFGFHWHLGRLYARLLDTEAAVRELRRAAEIEPDSYPARALLGMNLFEAGRFDEALEELERARALDDSQHHVWKPLGLLYLHRGDREKARSALERARLFDPSDIEVQDHLDEMDGA